MTLPPAKLVQDAALHAVLPAFAAAAVLTGLVAAIVGRRAVPFVVPFSAAGGWAVGNYFCEISPWVPDGRRIEWLPILLGLAAGCGLLARLPGLFRGLFVGVLAVAVTRLLPATALTATWWLVPLFVGVTFLVGTTITGLGRKQPGVVAPAVMAISLFAAGTVAVHARSARLMEAAVIAGSAVAGIAVVCLWAADAGPVAPFAALTASAIGLLAYNDTENQLPAVAFLLPAAAPLAMTLADLPRVNKLTGRKRVILQLVLVALVATIAVGLAAYRAPIDFADFESL